MSKKPNEVFLYREKIECDKKKKSMMEVEMDSQNFILNFNHLNHFVFH